MLEVVVVDDATVEEAGVEVVEVEEVVLGEVALDEVVVEEVVVGEVLVDGSGVEESGVEESGVEEVVLVSTVVRPVSDVGFDVGVDVDVEGSVVVADASVVEVVGAGWVVVVGSETSPAEDSCGRRELALEELVLNEPVFEN